MGKMNDLALQADMRTKVFALEDVMRRMGASDELPTTHHFAPGVYARELKIPAGATAVGKIHKYDHLFILAQGELSVTTGGDTARIQAPYTVTSPGGTKRAVYAHTDCTLITIHPTDETDVAKIEDYFIAQDEAAYLAHEQRLIA